MGVQDLSQIALPVGFNEPISILQRLAEDLEYINLVEQAVSTDDPVERFCLVAAFAVSGYACTQLRATRKPFNPMLGETFEDSRFNFIAEKVCHVPPVMACHASGEGWTYDSVTQAKQKFWGRSLEIIPMGTTILTIGEDVYTW
jgi:oxysterol-binding protein-related protein 3/6/7